MTFRVKIYSTTNVLCGDFKVYDDTHPTEKFKGETVFKCFPGSSYANDGQLSFIDIFKDNQWVGRSICYNPADQPVYVGQKEDREVLLKESNVFMSCRGSL